MKVLIMSVNPTSLSSSCVDVQRSRDFLSVYTVRTSEANSSLVPSHSDNISFNIGALDDFGCTDDQNLWEDLLTLPPTVNENVVCVG